MFICGLHERARCMRENMFYPGFLSQGFIKWTLFFIVPITPLHTQHFWDIVQTCPWNIRIIQIYNREWKRVFITVNITFMNRIYHKFVVIFIWFFSVFPMFPFKLAHIVQDFNHEYTWKPFFSYGNIPVCCEDEFYFFFQQSSIRGLLARAFIYFFILILMCTCSPISRWSPAALAQTVFQQLVGGLRVCFTKHAPWPGTLAPVTLVPPRLSLLTDLTKLLL